MIQKVKNLIREQLYNKCYEKYDMETQRQKDCYKQWYLEHEGWKRETLNRNAMQKDAPTIGLPGEQKDIILIQFGQGKLTEGAETVLSNYFLAHPEAELVYTDEDRIDEEGVRVDPWFKPRWSPNTFESFCYFGSLVAVRRKWVEQFSAQEMASPIFLKAVTRDITLEYLLRNKKTGLGQIPSNEEAAPIKNLERVLFHRSENWEEAAGEWQKAVRASQPQNFDLISIIIPSKDHTAVLEKCILDIKQKTMTDRKGGKPDANKDSYEIIVVDNGSSAENKEKIARLGKQYSFTYLYQPMDFNFSAMCNIGAKEAKGDFLLFLNDDVEVLQGNWLRRLREMAARTHVGAVGAKLLFPNQNLIQHVGITNLNVGPAHKLLKADDKIPYYHGHNRFNYDMIGVTAACLMVRRTLFEQAEGFFEGMQVSYNDVDFCFKLYELGYYNVQRNDVVLYHHESLSRGDDNLSEEKWIRLLSEKDILYKRHPKLRGYDPFYSKNLAQHTHEYGPNYQYEYEKRDRITPVRLYQKPEPVHYHNPCLVVNVEHSRLQKKLDLTEASDSFWIEGWSYVMGSDNVLYDRKLLLIGTEGRIYELPVLTRYRKDVADILPEQVNVELSGFVCGIPTGSLPKDEYVIAMLARDRTSRMKLYTKSAAKLRVGAEITTVNGEDETKL